MWASRERCPQTANYRTRCGCSVSVKVAKGTPFPDCPICNRPTRWTEPVLRDLEQKARSPRRPSGNT